MNRSPFFLLLFVTLANGFIAKAQDKPDWINVTPISRSPNFKFFVSSGGGNTYEEANSNAHNSAIKQLVLYLGARVDSKTESRMEAVQKNQTYSKDRIIKEIITVVGSNYIKDYKDIERFEDKDKGGYIIRLLYVLVKDSVFKSQNFSHLQAGLRAIVPSYGQFYKRNTKKGWGILGGVAIVAAGSLYCKERAGYFSGQAKLFDSNPVHYSNYKQSQTDWQNRGNLTLFVGGGILYLYNVVDALATKGPRVYANHGNRWKLQPYYTDNHGGMMITYALK